MAKSQKKTAAAEKSSRQERQAREGKILVITACVMGAIILAFVLSILAGQIFQSDWFKQRANAVSVDGEKLSVADYNFFFYRSTMNSSTTSAPMRPACTRPRRRIFP